MQPTGDLSERILTSTAQRDHLTRFGPHPHTRHQLPPTVSTDGHSDRSVATTGGPRQAIFTGVAVRQDPTLPARPTNDYHPWVSQQAIFRRATLPPQFTIGPTGSDLYGIELDDIRLSGPTTLTLSAGATVRLDHVVLREPLTLTGLTLETPGRVRALTNATLLAPVTIGAMVDVHDATFRGSTGLEQLLFRVNPPWNRFRWRRFHWPTACSDRPYFEGGPRGRRVLTDEAGARQPLEAADPAAVEVLYRQLRAGLEASKAAPAAADFYFGEMEMRRLAAPRVSAERFWLAVYKWFGGYGVRAWRPFITYLGLLAATTMMLHARTNWFATDPLTATGAASIDGEGGLALTRYSSIAAFVTRNSISIFTAPAEGLTAAGTFLFIGERFASVTLLGLVVLALRSRVQR